MTCLFSLAVTFCSSLLPVPRAKIMQINARVMPCPEMIRVPLSMIVVRNAKFCIKMRWNTMFLTAVCVILFVLLFAKWKHWDTNAGDVKRFYFPGDVG